MGMLKKMTMHTKLSRRVHPFLSEAEQYGSCLHRAVEQGMAAAAVHKLKVRGQLPDPEAVPVHQVPRHRSLLAAGAASLLPVLPLCYTYRVTVQPCNAHLGLINPLR